MIFFSIKQYQEIHGIKIGSESCLNCGLADFRNIWSPLARENLAFKSKYRCVPEINRVSSCSVMDLNQHCTTQKKCAK